MATSVEGDPNVLPVRLPPLIAPMVLTLSGAPAGATSIHRYANTLEEKAIGYVIVSVFPVPIELLPPWVQVGNDADPDERHGSFTENRQNWKHCPDAG